MNDPYSVLGAPADADQDLIDSIYVALLKAFHPDTFKGDPAFAQRRLEEITSAYTHICRNMNPKKVDMDAEIQLRAVSSARWARACQFFPDLHKLDTELSHICVRLSESFRRKTLASKDFSHAADIRNEIERQFGVTTFGYNETFRKIGIEAIKQGRHAFALALMDARDLLGDGFSERKVSRLSMEHPEDALSVLTRCGLESLLKTSYQWLRPGLYSLGNMARLRIFQDVGVIVFSEFGKDLDPQLRFPSPIHLLVHYGKTIEHLRPIEI